MNDYEDAHQDVTGDAARPEAEISEARAQRRALLKKAAVGATVSGAVWAAPKVVGLSIAPEFAAAGTVTGLTKTLRFDSIKSGGNGNDAGCDITDDFLMFRTNSNPGQGWNTSSPRSRAQGGGNVQTSAPLGVAGNVTANVAGDFPMDGDSANGKLTLTFDVDPPFNRCRVNAATYVDCPGLIDGADPAGMPISGANPASAPTLNTTAPFIVTVNLPDSGTGTPDNQYMVITIGCL